MRAAQPFFVTGGTIGPRAPCYAEREADALLLEALLAGEFCYLLTPRQMGKSSLMVRTAGRLRAADRRVALLDLTAFGENLTAEQWYRGLLGVAGGQLGCESELEEYWATCAHQSPVQRWFGALSRVALTGDAGEGRANDVVLFVDEVDFVRSLPFSTTEFFAGVRELYNRRAVEPHLHRLTFCLLGVATPADLIENPLATPFNIGRRIELADLTPAEARILETGLSPPGVDQAEVARELLQRVLYWTGGHPYLTQRLCQAVVLAAEEPEQSRCAPAARVDDACRRTFLTGSGRRSDDNLLFAADRLLRGSRDRAGVLELYGRVLRRRFVAWDSSDPRNAALEMSGVARRAEAGSAVGTARPPGLVVRNRLYAAVFDRQWVRDNMPDAERRRQAAAFQRGVWRAALAGGVGVALVGGLAAATSRSEQRAQGLNRDLETALTERDATLRKVKQMLDRETRLRETAQRQTAVARRAREKEQEARLRADQASLAATRASEVAMDLAQVAERNAQEARRHEAESRRLVAAQAVREGWRLVEQGNLPGSLVWFTAALRAEAADPARAAIHRLRIASVSAACPALLGIWRVAAPVTTVRAGSGSRWLALATADGSAHLLDLTRPAAPPVRSSPARPAARPQSGGQWRFRSGEYSVGHRQAVSLPARESVLRAAAAGQIRFVPRVGPEQRWPAAEGQGGGILSDDGRWALRWGRFGARLVDLEGASERVLTRESCGFAAFSANSARVVLHLAYRVRVFDTRSGTPRAGWPSTPDSTPVLSPDGSRVAQCGPAGFELRDVETGRDLDLRQGAGGGTTGVEFTPDSARLVCLVSSGSLRVWDTHTVRPLSSQIHTGEGFTAHCLSPDGASVVTAGRTVTAWDLVTGRRVAGPIPLGDTFARTIACLPEGDRVAVGCEDGTVRLWSLARRQPDWRQAPRRAPVGLAATGASRRRAGGSAHRVPQRAGSTLQTDPPPFPGEPLDPLVRVLSPRGERVLTSTTTEGVRLYSRAHGARPIAALPLRLLDRAGPAHPDRHVTALAFSQDGAWIATGTRGGQIRVWSLDPLRTVGPAMEQTGPIRRIALSADRRFLSVVGDTGLRIWDRGAGEAVTPLLPLPGTPSAGPQFSPDGRLLEVTLTNGQFARLSLQPDTAPLPQLELRSELLAGVELPGLAPRGRVEGEALLRRWNGLRGRLPGGSGRDLATRIAWHGGVAASFVEGRQWNAAAEHLEALRRLLPNRRDLALQRANALAELGRLEEAAAEQEFALTGSVSEAGMRIGYYRLALLRLANRDQEGYQIVCRTMWEALKDRRAANVVDLLNWTLALGPGAAPNPSAALVRQQQLIRTEPRALGARNTQGALLYRSGQFQEAIAVLEQVAKERGGNGDFSDRVFLALAYAAAGAEQSAALWLRRTEEAYQEHLIRAAKRDNPAEPGPNWADRLEHRVLMEEAREAVSRTGRTRPAPERTGLAGERK